MHSPALSQAPPKRAKTEILTPAAGLKDAAGDAPCSSKPVEARRKMGAARAAMARVPVPPVRDPRGIRARACRRSLQRSANHMRFAYDKAP
jgi:hypothetical protein